MDGKIDKEFLLNSCDDLKTPRGKYGVYFKEIEIHKGSDVQFVPRSVLVDMEPGVIDGIRGGKLRDLFKPDHMINGGNLQFITNILPRTHL